VEWSEGFWILGDFGFGGSQVTEFHHTNNALLVHTM
jgi:hypothetical protein